MRTDNRPLARPVFSDSLMTMNVASIHTISPSDIIGEHDKNTIDISCIEAIINVLENLNIVIYELCHLSFSSFLLNVLRLISDELLSVYERERRRGKEKAMLKA
jgi:hypothetical protein